MTQRGLGMAAIVGAGLAIAGNAALFVVHPVVPKDRLSWPLSAHAYVFMQIFFAATQWLLALGILGLIRSDVVSVGGRVRSLGLLAVVGMSLTVPGELVLIAVRNDAASASAVNQLSGVFGLGVLLADVGLIGFGFLALRERHWPRVWAASPLALGAFQLLVVTPVSFSAGFTSVASNVTIGIADALTALIGLRVMRSESRKPGHETTEMAAIARSTAATR